MVKKNKVLIISSGGREHAIGWKLQQSPNVGKIFFAPGTIGTEQVGISTGIAASDFDSLIAFAIENKIDLTVAAPDDVLALGIVDVFQEKGLKIFGPTKEASEIESSKAFAKELMKKENIPTAKYQTFKKAMDAKEYLKNQPFPVVIKASGLALGKGVVISKNLTHALITIDEIMTKKIFGEAGKEVVIEEFMEGREVSIHVLTDGKNYSIFPTSRDHKPIFDNNLGPNTGGMGTIARLTDVTEKDIEIIKKKIVEPILKGLKKRGSPFTGCLYPGLMMTKTGPKVIEFNSRFGDPEIESYMRLLKTDLFDILLSCTNETLSEINIKWSKDFACCIVLASKNYPEGSHKGDIINGLKKYVKDKDIVVFHFATKKEKGKIVTNGGRVLGITATGKTLAIALKKAYSVISDKEIHFDGMQFRKDIGTYGN